MSLHDFIYGKAREVVSCATCGCLIDKELAHEVKTDHSGSIHHHYPDPVITKSYFCKAHKPAYDLIKLAYFSHEPSQYYRFVPEHYCEVTTKILKPVTDAMASEVPVSEPAAKRFQKRAKKFEKAVKKSAKKVLKGMTK